MLFKSDVIYRIKSIINTASASSEQSDKLFSIFVAMYAAQSVKLPSDNGVDLANFIVENKIDREISKIISPINEVIIIDYAAVRRLALQFYNFRYAMAYGGAESVAFIFAAFTGAAGDVIIEDAVQTLNSIKSNSAVNDAFNTAFKLATSTNV